MRFTSVIPSTIPMATDPWLQFWLLGYEFPATLMVFTLDGMWVVTTAKKGAPFTHVEGSRLTPLQLSIWSR